MTSWNRGKENEEIGEAEMQSPNAGDKIAGAGRKIEGEAEQGINNLGDTISGKQHDLEGKERNAANDMGNAANRAGNDMKDTADRGQLGRRSCKRGRPVDRESG